MAKKWKDGWKVDVETPLRQGGQGTVRRVVSVDGAREGALKMLLAENQFRRERRFRMRQEVEALLALPSGVPKLLDTNAREAEKSEPLFFVMEWINGPTLSDHANQKTMPIDGALRCTLALLSTLEDMHSLPIIHRDLKPSNVILRNGELSDPIIIDLGIAWADTEGREDDFETELGQEIGNRFLRLPENAPGRMSRDSRSDVTLAAGLLLFMLSKHAPRLLRDEEGRAPHEALVGHIPQSVTTDHRWPRISRVFGRAFQTELALRFQSARELSVALSNLDPIEDPEDTLSPALEKLAENLESERWNRAHRRRTSINALGAEFDGHLRALLRPTGLSLPGGHGFDSSGRTYRNNIGLQMPNVSGATVCNLNHTLEITDTELIATHQIGGQTRETYYRGPLADLEGLKEAMWRNANRLVTLSIDEFNEIIEQ